MPLTVLNVGYPFAPVAPDTAGGAEQVLAEIDEALVRAGHHSIVLAPRGSQISGELIPAAAVPQVIDMGARHQVHLEFRVLLQNVLRRREIDVMHMHGLDFTEYLPADTPPTIVTIHLPPGWYPATAFRNTSQRMCLVCVSESQRAACPGPVHDVVPNGVGLDRFHPDPVHEQYVLCIGRICPEKGYHHALDAATRCGRQLLLGGTVFPYLEHEEYFSTEIEPRLQNRHQFLGPVSGEEKRRLLARAHCVVIPSQASETSSLVAMEALACGTPVVALRVGALPEIVEHGRTGLLVDHPAELADAIEAAAQISRAECRAVAEERFPAHRMTDSYLRLYEQMAEQPAPLAEAA